MASLFNTLSSYLKAGLTATLYSDFELKSAISLNRYVYLLVVVFVIVILTKEYLRTYS